MRLGERSSRSFRLFCLVRASIRAAVLRERTSAPRLLVEPVVRLTNAAIEVNLVRARHLSQVMRPTIRPRQVTMPQIGFIRIHACCRAAPDLKTGIRFGGAQGFAFLSPALAYLPTAARALQRHPEDCVQSLKIVCGQLDSRSPASPTVA